MRSTEAESVRGRLSTGRRLFPYFPDRYALLRLARFVGDGMSVREVRASPLGRMLDRPAVRPIVASCGGVLTADALAYAWPARPDAWGLSFGIWRFVQTTRFAHNLVVHLDLPRSYRRVADAVAGEKANLQCDGHPSDPEELTYAWARVDVDLERREALVEEVQSDAVRAEWKWWPEDTAAVVTRRMPRSAVRTWAEATLAATLEVLQDELGVTSIWYHTHEGGRVAKGIPGTPPPRSLYTELPKRFGFVEVDEQPAMFADLKDRERRRLAGVRFQRLVT